ncbi:hypothetical protein Tco_0296095, partial [Tanacetum coccineum]
SPLPFFGASHVLVGCVETPQAILAIGLAFVLLLTQSHHWGCFGLCVLTGKGVIRVNRLWEVVGVSWESTWEVVWQEKPWERGGFLEDCQVNDETYSKGIKFRLGEQGRNAFQLIKQSLQFPNSWLYTEGSEDFVVYCDASHKAFSAGFNAARKEIAMLLDILKVHEKLHHS